MDDASKYGTVLQYLRITYGTDAAAITQLKALATSLFSDATEAVTLTAQTFASGSHSGQIMFPRIMYLQAVLARLIEIDPTIDTGPTNVTYAAFNLRPFEL